jgi:3-oxoacyl-[acyl-carrier protein] reductase
MTGRELIGRVALVTGSARNIGRAIAIDLARGGAAVMINARTSAAEAADVAAAIRSEGGHAEVTLADVADPAGAEALVRATIAAFGRLDILVNNASVRREVEFADLDYPQWREILAITLDGAYLCSHAALPYLKQSGAQGNASIVNIGGLTAHTGASRRAHVVAAKAGLVGLTRALAHDLAADGVTVNCVAPGLIETVRTGGSTSGGQPHHHAERAPLSGRRGHPQEVAALVRFLCGPDARYITGQTLHANGGLFLG